MISAVRVTHCSNVSRGGGGGGTKHSAPIASQRFIYRKRLKKTLFSAICWWVHCETFTNNSISSYTTKKIIF